VTSRLINKLAPLIIGIAVGNSAVAASAGSGGPGTAFSKHSTSIGVFVGSGSAFNDDYTILGVGAGYYLTEGLEIGVDLERGVDEDARAWVERGWPVTYHFLDVNLEEAEDLDEAWTRDARRLAGDLGAAWMCGDAGLWHVGPRERGRVGVGHLRHDCLSRRNLRHRTGAPG